MKSSLRIPLTVLAAASISMLAAGCKPADKAAGKPAANTEQNATIKSVPELPTEKDQVSYMIGMAMGKQLVMAKDEVDVDVLAKAIRTSMSGQKLLLTDQQASEIAQA